ncbi:hypothetical protein NP92_02790 [Anoxybacillus gonensis]|uniref:Uncharacterized protein n=1 Tax=Anoxybacillus gonensis TaxID=198467 RepID=A0AAW7TFM6_9BACL|nr:hypothetical protein [Anoxybacillus gonensis]AKS37404.1 hypothetical protein AFK25_02360 [Anoxybacillus gonensis]KGP61343.1 hypothetical protein NP92_02790 [Anoxybacillus gonensis]MDO0876790.1 hypothetical protein [Anoxybacillus gonensis]
MSEKPFEGIKSIEVPKIKLDLPYIEPRVQSTIISIKEIEKAFKKKQEKEEEYKKDLLQTLKNIEANTVGLSEIVPLLSKSNESQEKIAELLKESLDIAASKSKEEAENKWRAIMNKANQLTTDVETIQKIHGFANTILSLFQNLSN